MNNSKNVMSLSSLMNNDIYDQYKASKFSVIYRNYDRIFFFALGKRLKNKDGTDLVKFLRAKVQADDVVKGLSGYKVAQQMYPQGYALYDEKYKCDSGSPEKSLSGKKLKIKYSPTRVSGELLANIKNTVTKSTGVEPTMISIDVKNFEKEFAADDFDLYAGSISITDPNVDGAMSFIFELKTPIIHSGEGKDNFVNRLVKIRLNKDEVAQNEEFKKIMYDATCGGYIMPIFHYSTVVVSRNGIDLSKIPITDEMKLVFGRRVY